MKNILKSTPIIILLLFIGSIIFTSCEDPIEDDEIIEQIEEEEVVEEGEAQDSSVVELPCQLISYTYQEDERFLNHEVETEGSNIVKNSTIITNGTDEAIIEAVFDYDGYDLISYQVNTYLNGEPYSDDEYEENYFVVDSEDGILNSLTHVQKYIYEDVYYTSFTKEEYAYEGTKLSNVKFSYVDASDPNTFLEESSVDLFLSSEDNYKYNSAGNLIEEERIYYYSKSTQKRPERSSKTQLIEDYFGTKRAQSKQQKNVTEIYNYQHDDKLNPFSGLNVTSLAILNWGALFDASQLLSTNNLSSASSTQNGTGDDPSTRQITITYNNTYNSANLLEGMTRDYMSVYTTPDFENVNESQYIYDFAYTCE